MKLILIHLLGFFLDYVGSSIQYMALFISITVCSIFLGVILVICCLRYES